MDRRNFITKGALAAIAVSFVGRVFANTNGTFSSDCEENHMKVNALRLKLVCQRFTDPKSFFGDPSILPQGEKCAFLVVRKDRNNCCIRNCTSTNLVRNSLRVLIHTTISVLVIFNLVI